MPPTMQDPDHHRSDGGGDDYDYDNDYDGEPPQQKWRQLSYTSPNGPFESTPLDGWGRGGDPAGGPGPGSSPVPTAGPHASSASASASASASTSASALASVRSSAMVSAQYYASCALAAIPPSLADGAVRSVHSAFRYWWDQGGIGRRMVGGGDAEVTRTRVAAPRAGGGEDDAGSVASSAAGSAVGGVSSNSASAAGAGASILGRVVGGAAGSGRKRPREEGPALAPLALVSEGGKRPSGSQQQQQQQSLDGIPRTLPSSTSRRGGAEGMRLARLQLLESLKLTGGDVTAEPFLRSLDRLLHLDRRRQRSLRRARAAPPALAPGRVEGMWLTLSRPNYHGCLGINELREYQYTLGRMSFGMYRPTSLVCSVQGVFNPVHVVDAADRDEVESVPRGLRQELMEGKTTLRTYNIVTAFSIEPGRGGTTEEVTPNDACGVTRPIRGIMTTYSYVLPDPSAPGRLSVWFTGGIVEVDDEADAPEWKRILGGGGQGKDQGHGRETSMQERAKLLAAKLLLGATVEEEMAADGSFSFELSRPVGGHGSAYVDVLYLDDTLRIMRGHHGSLYVLARVPTGGDDDKEN